MQSTKSIKSEEMLEKFLLLDFVRRCDEDVREGRCKPLEQAFVELRQQAERMKVLYADIFNNNQTRGRERPS